MIKQIHLIFLLLIHIVGISQTINIKGLALDTVKSRNFVMIDVNDTLKKFRNNALLTKKWEGYKELTENKNFVTHTDSVGNFNISAKLTDSLYFYTTRYLTQKHAVSDLLKRNKIIIQLEPEKCIPFVSCEQKKPSNYYIFIGKKIALEGQKQPYYCNTITMDSEFKSTYKIEKNLYGKFQKDTIVFTAYDHYGIPNFSKNETVLLFVGEYCDKLFHEKYQYFDLYKTKNGKWASPGNPYKNDNYAKENNLVPKKIFFEKTVCFDISKLNTKQIENEYPAEYYTIIENKAIPIMGTYVEDLVEIKKNGILKARKIDLK